jgi:phosphatidylserine/phosphatidylglycerophosphate/cardiolipin synthase-like enzyme
MVNNNQKSVFVDDEIASQMIDIIQEAQQCIIITTAYLKLWQHATTALGLAVKKGVKVTVIIGRREHWKSETREDIAWLLDNGIRVMDAKYLHAKIYLNERSVFLSSMNLTEFSTKNSLDIGLVVQDAQAERQVREYVNNTLMQLAKPVSAPQTEPRQQPVTTQATPRSGTGVGACIRCGLSISPDTSKPLCDDCYDEWAEYENENYQERFCHVCGKPSDVSYAKPLCRDCFRRLN